MQRTYPEAYFNFVDVTALADGRALSTAAKDFADTDLFREDVRQTLYGTMEHNQFVLDGSRTIFPSGQPDDVPFWSDEKSDENGLYAKNPTLEIIFAQAHSSVGLNLYFAEDIPGEIRITWYTLQGTKLESGIYHPDSKEYFCEQHVQDYGRLEIEIIKSAFPYRYAKMDHIEYGRMWMLGEDNIQSASVYEEIDPISATLSINTAKIEIVDPDNDFDPANEGGLWRSLQKEQEISIVEYVDGTPVDCGTFYLDDWSSRKNVVSFAMTDIIGVMDKTKFYGGAVYEDVAAGVIIDNIMASAGVRKYAVEEEIYHMPLSGWLGIQSHRAALQQVMFACGAVADCSRGDWLRIYSPDRYVSHTIGTDRKFTGTRVTLDKYVSSVAVAYSHYVPADEGTQIAGSILPAGETRIEFTEPYVAESITASSGRIVKTAVNYVIVSMDTEQECILTGRKYEAVENTYTASTAYIEAGETAETKSYRGCTLMDAVRARQTAERILGYLQLRQQVDMRYINAGEAVGNWCGVDMAGGGQSTTCIINQTLDLTGGNLATAQCRGYNRTVTSYYFAGTEIYAGEDGVI